MRKQLDLYKLWEICNKLSEKQDELSENSIYVYLLGNRSKYNDFTFESFLEYYSFKIWKDMIAVYNDDPIAWESFSNDDYSYIPICLLSFSAENLEKWIADEIEKQLKQQEETKIQEKESIKLEIERLTKQLNNL